MKRPVLLLTGAVLLAACSGGGGAKVATGLVQRADVREVVDAPGAVTARATSTVSAPADATVVAVLVKDGQAVRKGAVLVRLGSVQAQQRLQQAESAQVNASGSRVVLPSADVGPLQDQVDAAAAAALTAGRTAAAQISDPKARQRAQDAVTVAEARYRTAAAAARAAVDQANAGVGSVQSALDAFAGSQRAGATASVSAARATVEGLTVRAPIDGVVSLGNGGSPAGAAPDVSSLISSLPAAVQGQAQQALGGAGPGSTSTTTGALAVGSPIRSGAVVVTVTDTSGLGLTADVDETDVLLVRPGIHADVELDAVPDTSYAATVTSVDLAPTTSARGGVSYRVRLTLQRGAGPAPRPGMSAVVNLRVRTVNGAVSVPAASVVREGSSSAVFVVERGRARRRAVVLGAQGADRDEVRSGVVEGERVVVRDADKLHDGQVLR